MTMHLPDYDPAPRRRAGLALVRQDVHVHAAIADVRALLADPTTYRPWLPDAVRTFEADSEGFRARISLPGRTEDYALRRVPTDNTRELAFERDEAGAAHSFTWALYPEGQRECHVTVEVVYRPASGFLGGAMETLLHRPQRVQVLRDLLWSLKQGVEGSRNGHEADGRDRDGGPDGGFGG
jgi:hypothetical protein